MQSVGWAEIRPPPPPYPGYVGYPNPDIDHRLVKFSKLLYRAKLKYSTINKIIRFIIENATL